jgi:predicted phosphoribosyltransferase
MPLPYKNRAQAARQLADLLPPSADRPDEVVCPAMPEPFLGIGRWYGDFTQFTDEETRGLLERVRRHLPPEKSSQ